jgi:hypothetical protein
MKHKTIVVITLLALSGALAVPAVRADDGAKEKPVSSRDMKKYDADKDGKLSPEEDAVRTADKEKAKAKRAEKRAEKKAEKEKLKAEKSAQATAEQK